MTKWRNYPVLYEINTWVWLNDLSRIAGQPVTLGTVPQAELERIAGCGFDGVWLMGVWQRSPQGRQVALQHPDLQAGYREALPDFDSQDVVGSPYAVFDYRVDSVLGSDEELEHLRERLRALGMLLILDFVPNHLAVDHPWIDEEPERLVQGGADDLARKPGNYFDVRRNGLWRVFAHGRDPNFAGWSDTVQLDYRQPQTRRAMVDVLLSIAERCDGVRCDMAMLVMHDIFLRTWGGEFAPERSEFWPAAITDVQVRFPGFLMLAEAYWDLEWELQQQGFDYTYDKRLYDRLLDGDAMSVRLHMHAEMPYQRRLARFIENHDERRAAEAFGPTRSRVAAVLALTLPGLRLVHEGQMEGWRRKLPVQLGRRFEEPVEAGLETFYRALLQAVRHPVWHEGDWKLLRPREEWTQNPTHRHVVAHRWTLGDSHRVVVANLSDREAQCFLPLEIQALAGQFWALHDLISGVQWRRVGNELLDPGLYLDLPGYGYHVLELKAL